MTLINSFRTGERHIDTMSIFYSETFPYLYCEQVLIQNIVSFAPIEMRPLVLKNSKTKPAQQIYQMLVPSRSRRRKSGICHELWRHRKALAVRPRLP